MNVLSSDVLLSLPVVSRTEAGPVCNHLETKLSVTDSTLKLTLDSVEPIKVPRSPLNFFNLVVSPVKAEREAMEGVTVL